MDPTGKSEINEGDGTYDEETDSQEAIRDDSDVLVKINSMIEEV
jgi:hypothetical protein